MSGIKGGGGRGSPRTAEKGADGDFRPIDLSRAMYSCSMLARKIIAFGAERIREGSASLPQSESAAPDTSATFRISELLRALGLTRCKRNYELVRATVAGMRTLGVEPADTSRKYLGHNWFQSIFYDEDEGVVSLRFSQEIGRRLLGLADGYTAMHLRTIGEFKSFYAFRLYEIAISWMGNRGQGGNAPGTWFFQMTEDEIRRTFMIPDGTYAGRANNFFANVIRRPLDELNSVNPEFSVEVTRVKRGRTTVAFRFGCHDKAVAAATPRDDGRREADDELGRLERLKERFPERWGELLEFCRSKPSRQPTARLSEWSAETNAGVLMLAEFRDEPL